MAFILVIDDDGVIRNILRHVLEVEGHEVREAQDGAEGVRLFKRRRPDLVLCDIFMPEKEGLETIRELGNLDPRVKIVAMSGGLLGFQDFLPLAKQFGAIDTLTKPFDKTTLLGSVEKALRGPA